MNSKAARKRPAVSSHGQADGKSHPKAGCNKHSIRPEEHLGLIYHIAHSPGMNIPEHLRDEAISEGLVLLVQAAQSYQPKHKVPAGHWIAKKLRWGLLNWRNQESRRHKLDISLQEEPDQDVERTELAFHVDKIAQHLAKLELESLVKQAGEKLSDREYVALFGPVFGMHMKELSHVLGANPSQIKQLQDRGRERVLEMRLL